MIDERYNPNDPAFLFSRSLDEKLSEDEQRQLDAALNDSASLQQEAEQTRRINRWIRSWGKQGADLDWEHHARLVAALLTSHKERAQLQQVDHLLARWGGDVPLPEPEGFVEAVMSRVRLRRRRRSRSALIFRIGAPLAAAAAIALVVTAGWWRTPSRSAISIVSVGPPARRAVQVSEGESRSQVLVSFARGRVASGRVPDTAVGFGWVGASPFPNAMLEDAPL